MNEETAKDVMVGGLRILGIAWICKVAWLVFLEAVTQVEVCGWVRCRA